MENQTVPTQIQTPKVPIKSFKFPIIPVLLAILVILLGLSGYLYYQNIQLKSMLASYQAPVVSPTPSATADPTANWKTYTNNLYTFQIKYPQKFNLTEDKTKEDFYDKLASLVYQDANISIRAIHDIDIYKNSKPQDVATREVIDSGLKYNIINTTISGYPAAITVLETIPKIRTTATIANPNKNIFIEISSDVDTTTFNQILSTFKFTEAVSTSSFSPKPSSQPQ